MCRLGTLVCFAGVAIMFGCSTAGKRPELIAPREDFHQLEPGLFSETTKYPSDMLNRVPLRKKKDDEDSMPAMGGPGMGNSAMPSAAGMGR
jgi:hypothetical protein